MDLKVRRKHPTKFGGKKTKMTAAPRVVDEWLCE